MEIRLEQLNQQTNKFLELLSSKPIKRLILTTVSIKAQLSKATQESIENLNVNYYNHLRDHQRPNLFNPFRQGRFNEPLDEQMFRFNEIFDHFRYLRRLEITLNDCIEDLQVTRLDLQQMENLTELKFQTYKDVQELLKYPFELSER